MELFKRTNPKEVKPTRPLAAWHSNAWASSIRITSGQYAHLSTTQSPIFTSDFVTHLCKKPDCSCLITPHLGRIIAVGKDHRSSSSHEPGAITLQVQKVATCSEWSRFTLTVLNPPMEMNELILFEDSIEYLLESSILSIKQDIFLDYSLGSRVEKGTPSISSSQVLVRRLFSSTKRYLRPLNQSHPIRAELELGEFTRQHFVEKFDVR